MRRLHLLLLTITIFSSTLFATNTPTDIAEASAADMNETAKSDWRVDSLRWEARLTATAGTGDFSAFWFASNTYRMGSVRPNNLRLQAGI